LTQDSLFSSRRCSFLFSSVQGHSTPKKNKCSLAKIAARVNWGAAANCAFEAVFQAVSSFFTIARLAAIGEKMNILLG
jgi:hypothetical protein